MGDNKQQDIAAVLGDEDMKLRELAKMYGNMSLAERIRKTLNGLSAPKESGEYKFARLQIQRSVGPILAVLIPLGGIAFLLSIQKDVDVRERTQQVEIQEIEDAPEVEDTPETPEDVEFLDPVDVDFDGPTSDAPAEAAVETADAPVSPKPAEMNSVAQIESPIALKGILGSRNPGQRGTALNRWGVGDGDAIVMKALRWLKSVQNKDGSWGKGNGNLTSMTSLTILAFLAHGETPNDSDEFGETVNKALQFLIDEYDYKAGTFKYRDGNNYSHPMAVYALSEAYSMTRNPNVKEVAEAATAKLVNGQYKSGTWAYNMKYNDNYPVGDTSYAGWCAQAVKAAHTAELDVPGLDECYNKAKHGFDDLNHPDGGFGYNKPGRGGLSCVGALCMQLLGEWESPRVAKTMDFLKDATYDFANWKNQPWKGGASPVYYWYYLTQAKFQVGGETFKSWNQKFYPELSKRQTVIPKEKSGYVDAEGKPREIGYWDSPSEGESLHDTGSKGNWDLPCSYFSGDGKEIPGKTSLSRRVMDTALTSLQLMVYYRFLPASQAVNQPEAAKTKKVKANEVKVGLKKKKKS